MAKSRLYGNNGPGDKKKKKKVLSFDTKADAAQYQADLKAPITKAIPKKASVKAKKKRLATPNLKVAKTTFIDDAGKPHSSKMALIRANRKLKANTQVGDYNPRTGKMQK